MKVKAVNGVRVPMEGQPHQYITDEQTVEVENTLYYQRRLADGDLIQVEDNFQAVNTEQKQAKKGEK